MRYETHDDVELRLGDSVLLFEGEPVYVKTVPGQTSVCLHNLKTDEKFVIDANSESLKLQTPSLGSVNLRDQAVYGVRTGFRSQKQGLTGTNCLFVRPLFERLGKYASFKGVNLKSPEYREEFYKMFKGQYEPYEVALKRFKEGREASVSKRLILARYSGVPVLFYRGIIIGMYLQKSNHAVLGRDFKNDGIVNHLEQYMTVK